MCGGHCPDAAAAQCVQDGDSQSRSFGWIGSGAQFVKKHKRPGVCILQDGDDIAHMGRKGTETLLNTLFIADICEYIVKNSQFAAVSRGNMQACLSHQSKQTYSFQRNGLAAGIGTGYDQKLKVIPKMHINRDDFMFIQQRMTSLADPDPSLCIKDRFHAIVIFSQLSFRENKVQFRQNPVIIPDIGNVLCCKVAEVSQDNVDFFFFLQELFFQVVV